MNFKIDCRLIIVKNKLLLLLSFFLFLRFACSYFWGWGEIINDGTGYNDYALAILNKADWLLNPNFGGNSRPPVYPLFLSLIYSIFGAENLLAVYFFQSIISIFTMYFIFKLSSAIFGEKISYLPLIWAGLYPYYNFYAGRILRETLLYFLIIYAFYCLYVFLTNNESTHMLKKAVLWKFIIALTLLVHTDARYLFYIPFISILFVINKNFRIGIKQYFIVLGLLILMLIPW